MSYRTKFHRNGDVTIWNVYTQGWQRTPAGEVSARVLASLSEAERARIARIAKVQGWRAEEWEWE